MAITIYNLIVIINCIYTTITVCLLTYIKLYILSYMI